MCQNPRKLVNAKGNNPKTSHCTSTGLLAGLISKTFHHFQQDILPGTTSTSATRSLGVPNRAPCSRWEHSGDRQSSIPWKQDLQLVPGLAVFLKGAKPLRKLGYHMCGHFSKRREAFLYIMMTSGSPTSTIF